MNRKPPFKTVGEREICLPTPAGREEYKRRREERWDMDRGICCLCGQFVPLEEATTEHHSGRGMGGGKRDDRVDSIRVAHLFGNNAKGSVSLDRYLQFPLDVRIANCKGYR